MAIGLITYQDAARREDLTDILTNISPKETPLLSGLQTGPDAVQTLHEFLTATFAAAADNAHVEGSGFTVVDLTQPTRANNITQIFLDNIQVSRTEAKVSIGGMANAFEYQIEKNMTEHAKDIELALMCGSRASGSSGVARRMDGVMASITTMKTARNSGDSLSETVFNDIMEMVKGQTDEIVDEVYAGATLRRDISGFSGNTATRFMIDAEDRRLINTIDVYVSKIPRLLTKNLAICGKALKPLTLLMEYDIMDIIWENIKVKVQGIKQWAIRRKDCWVGLKDLLMVRELLLFLRYGDLARIKLQAIEIS